MSYCRFSSNDFDCDLYCYESDTGFITHVALTRVAGVPKLPLLREENQDEWLAQYRKRSEFLGKALHTPIGLPHDGASFSDDTLEGFRDTLLMLRAAGYRFPDDVLKAVDEEIAAAGKDTNHDPR